MSGSHYVRARWVLPIDRPPVDDGWVEIRGGIVVSLGRGVPPAASNDLGDCALLPGLVNAHTHVELSGLAGRVPPADTIVEWIRALIAARSAAPPPDSVSSIAAMRHAVQQMRETGTVLVGDVSNSLTSVPVLAAAGLGGVVFHELLGFNLGDASGAVRAAWARAEDAVRLAASSETTAPGASLAVSIAAHAPYSVSPALFNEIGRRRRETPLTVHVAESAQEIQFLRTGDGPFRDLLDELGAWNPEWVPPRCGPIEYLRDVGYLSPGMLAVHAVHMRDDDLERLRASGAGIVTCPRSNAWVGGGLPRISAFYAAGIPVAIGTDSLASAPSLNLFDELAELRRIAPDVSAASLLESATRRGAALLGFDRWFGTVAPGKRASLVSVRVPPGTADVEEYLVSGVPVSSVQPLVF
jgi:cytosine/adenosine deaminase-related metal-dependent hydrolase